MRVRLCIRAIAGRELTNCHHSFADVFDQLDQLGENGRVSEIFLAMVDADSSVVYYVLKRGVVSPKEVRE